MGFCGGREVIGVHYNPNLPWEARKDILCAYEKALSDYAAVYIIANSIGAYFSMLALQGHEVKMALFISPVVDMEGLILNMMRRANVTENELRERGEAPTSFGETLSWEYLSYVRDNPEGQVTYLGKTETAGLPTGSGAAINARVAFLSLPYYML